MTDSMTTDSRRIVGQHNDTNWRCALAYAVWTEVGGCSQQRDLSFRDGSARALAWGIDPGADPADTVPALRTPEADPAD